MKNSQKGFALSLILGITALLLVAGGAYLYIQKNGNSPVAAQIEGSQVADWKIYTNTEYGFQLTLNDAWKGYRVEKTERTDGYGNKFVTLDFEVPTQDEQCFVSLSPEGRNWMAPDTSINILTKDDWDKTYALETGNEGGPGLVKFASNDDYVFMLDSYGPRLGNRGCSVGFENDYPIKYSNGVLKTFRLLK